MAIDCHQLLISRTPDNPARRGASMLIVFKYPGTVNKYMLHSGEPVLLSIALHMEL